MSMPSSHRRREPGSTLYLTAKRGEDAASIPDGLCTKGKHLRIMHIEAAISYMHSVARNIDGIKPKSS
jgi:hypothetical protein